MIGHEDYELWLRDPADHKSGRINKYSSALVSFRQRSIKGFMIDQTMHQRKHVLAKFHKDAHLKNQYGNRLKRLNASYYLYAGVQSNVNHTFGHIFRLLQSALVADFSIVFTRRFRGYFA